MSVSFWSLVDSCLIGNHTTSFLYLQEACQVFSASFVNLHGRNDSNFPADLVQEWNVKESKIHIKHMF